MKRLLSVVVLPAVLAAVLPAVQVLAQELPLRHYTTTSEVNPLPATAVTALFQDRSGFLWLGAYEKGLARYDGQRIEVFDTTDGLASTGVWGMAQDGAGRLWVLESSGLRASEHPLSRYGPGERIRFVARIGRDSLYTASIGR